MSSAAQFVHLRVHSEYSLLQGAMRLKSLPDLCVRENMPAVAVTDKNNLFCALEFSVSASSKGIEPIIGCHIDRQYSVFGKVTEGMEFVDSIKKGDSNNNGSVSNPDKIISFRSE